MTPHIEAKYDEIAKTVLMPGDPLRAKFIANKYLENVKKVNEVRGMLAYTGYYKGKKITVMASGMGIPSMGIYSYELYNFYNVENIIRVGSCGTYTNKLKLYDLILVTNSYSSSTYSVVQNGSKNKTIPSSKLLNKKILETAKKNNLKITSGTVHCSDVFYRENDPFIELYNNYDCLAVEMETFSLFHNANSLNKEATCILTVSDNLVTKEETTSLERQNSFTQMIELALNSII